MIGKHGWLLTFILACGRSEAPPTSAADAAPVTLSLVTYSGRENPPPQIKAVGIGTEVTLHIDGLGPPRARVFAPDGAEVPTTDVGKDQRFTAAARGQYRVELAGAAGSVLAYVNVP